MTSATPKPRAGEHPVGREPMSTGKGLTAAESRAYQRGIAAANRGREDALTIIIRELEAGRDLLRERERELVEALAGVLSIEDTVTRGQESERRAEWLPKARALLAKYGR